MVTVHLLEHLLSIQRSSWNVTLRHERDERLSRCNDISTAIILRVNRESQP